MPPKSLDKLFLENRDVLFAFILALTRDHPIAEELFQETGVCILREAARGVEVANFMPWARQLARNRVADYYRKHQRRRGREQTVESLDEVVGRSFEENEVSAEESRRRIGYLLKCLERLTRRTRAMIQARYWDGQAIRQIAQRTRWKEASVKVALSRARRVLADCVTAKVRAAEDNRHGSRAT